MSYELTIDLKGGRLEIEGDSMDELAEKIAAVDVKWLEGLLRDARPGARRKTKKKATKKKAAKAGAKKAAARKSGAKKKTSSKKRAS